ncbi:MAG: LysM domain-containing protein [Burkholderiaceae bacterium]|nr:MAG: LysM domain-containing protein [Burkholderiaceae bacterium]
MFEYDRLGQRVADAFTKVADGISQRVRVECCYDALGRQSTTGARNWQLGSDGLTAQASDDSMVIDRRFYDARGNLIQSGRGEAYPASAPGYSGGGGGVGGGGGHDWRGGIDDQAMRDYLNNRPELPIPTPPVPSPWPTPTPWPRPEPVPGGGTPDLSSGGSSTLSLRDGTDGLAESALASSRMALMSAALPMAEADAPVAEADAPGPKTVSDVSLSAAVARGTPALDKGSVYLTAGAVDRETRRYVYDEFGQVVAQRVYDRDLKALYQVTRYQYDADGNNLSYQVTANLTEKSELLYTNTYTQYFASVGAQRQVYFTRVESSNKSFAVGSTYQNYTADGRLFSVDVLGSSYKRFYTDDEGQVIKAATADKAGANAVQRAEERQMVVNGQVLQRWGYAVNEARPKDDKGLPIYGPVSAQSTSVERIDLGSSVGQHSSVTAQAGDTLKSVAQRVYGDSSKWYLLAQANGLSPDEAVPAGATLQAPRQVAGTRNAADTFKPYDASQVVGDTSPYMAQLPQGEKGCGTFGQLLMIVVAVVVTVYTAGAGSWALGLQAMQAGSGMAVLGAMAGSVVSQLVGMATGDVEKFSFGAVLQAGMTAFLAPAIGRAELLSNVSRTTNVVVSAMASNAMVQGASIALDIQEHFSLRGVAAAGATAFMDSEVFKNAPSMAESVTLGSFGYRALQAGVNSLLSQGIKTGKWRPNQVTADALGAAIGESLKQMGASGEVDEVVALARVKYPALADQLNSSKNRTDILAALMSPHAQGGRKTAADVLAEFIRVAPQNKPEAERLTPSSAQARSSNGATASLPSPSLDPRTWIDPSAAPFFTQGDTPESTNSAVVGGVKYTVKKGDQGLAIAATLADKFGIPDLAYAVYAIILGANKQSLKWDSQRLNWSLTPGMTLDVPAFDATDTDLMARYTREGRSTVSKEGKIRAAAATAASADNAAPLKIDQPWKPTSDLIYSFIGPLGAFFATNVINANKVSFNESNATGREKLSNLDSAAVGLEKLQSIFSAVSLKFAEWSDGDRKSFSFAAAVAFGDASKAVEPLPPFMRAIRSYQATQLRPDTEGAPDVTAKFAGARFGTDPWGNVILADRRSDAEIATAQEKLVNMIVTAPATVLSLGASAPFRVGFIVFGAADAVTQKLTNPNGKYDIYQTYDVANLGGAAGLLTKGSQVMYNDYVARALEARRAEREVRVSLGFYRDEGVPNIPEGMLLTARKSGGVGNASNSAEAGSLAARLERVAARTPEEVADRARVAELIYKARAQGDPGVPQLISQLEKGGVKVKDTNHYLGSPSREVDIETESGIIIQVKKLSSAQKIIHQVQDTERTTGQPTIGYVLEQHKKANSIVQQAGRHVQVTNKFDVLLNWLRGE